MSPLPLLLALALGAEPPQAPSPAEAQHHENPEPEVAWAPTYPEAIEMARMKPEGRILVELTGPDCGECTRQEAIIFPSVSFRSFMRDKVAVRVNFSSPEGKKLAERFGIPAPPAWIVMTTDGLLCGIQGGPTSQSLWFETFVKTEVAWAEYRKRLFEEQRNPADLALVFAIAEETYKRGADDPAESRFRRLAESKASLTIREKSLAYLASIEMDQKRILEAEKDLQALLAMAGDPMLRQRAELRLADVEIAKGRKDLAIARLEQFKKDHPVSALVTEAEALLEALDPGHREKKAGAGEAAGEKAEEKAGESK